LQLTCDEQLSSFAFSFNLRRYIRGGGVFAWESVVNVAGSTRVSENVAPLGGGVYLLGEKAKLHTGGTAGHYSTTIRPLVSLYRKNGSIRNLRVVWN
jgi:hypothetical protein